MHVYNIIHTRYIFLRLSDVAVPKINDRLFQEFVDMQYGDAVVSRVLLDFSSPGEPVKLASVLKERCSGGCNVFHVLAILSKPQEPHSSSGSSSSNSQGDKRGVAARTTPRGGGGMLREIMKQAMALASGSSYPHPSMGIN